MLYHISLSVSCFSERRHFCSFDEDAGGKYPAVPIRAPVAFVSALAICCFLFPTQACVCVHACVRACVFLSVCCFFGSRLVVFNACRGFCPAVLISA